jgi:hypothetical protein
MQGALAERQSVGAPFSEEERRLRVVERPRRRSRRRPLLSRPVILLVLFAICLALLGVGRVTLTFAVVQESLDTAKLVTKQRTVRQANAELAERLARLNASTRVHNLAVSRLGLVAPSSVVYLPQGEVATVNSAVSSELSTSTSQSTGSTTPAGSGQGSTTSGTTAGDATAETP